MRSTQFALAGRSAVQTTVGSGLLCAIGLLLGCASSRVYVPEASLEDTYYRDRLNHLAVAIDTTSRYLDDWGTISVSAPLVDAVGEDFAFDLDIDDQKLYELARLEGSSQAADVSALLFQLGVKVAPTAGAVTNAAADVVSDASETEGAETSSSDQSGTQENTGEGENEGDSDTDPAASDEPVSADAPDNAALSRVGEVRAPSDFTSPTLTMNNRRRIRLAAGDRAELGLHRFLLSATNRELLKNYRVIYLPLTVTCSPGLRTSHGYLGRVSCEVEYIGPGGLPVESYARTLSDLPEPAVIGVYPSFNSQELDLRQSVRKLRGFAAALEVLGNEVGANSVLSYAERLEGENSTMTGLSVLTSFSNGGGHFGFEFRPEFAARTDLTSERDSAGYAMRPRTIPALAIVSVHKDLFDSSATRAFTADAMLRYYGTEEGATELQSRHRELLSLPTRQRGLRDETDGGASGPVSGRVEAYELARIIKNAAPELRAILSQDQAEDRSVAEVKRRGAETFSRSLTNRPELLNSLERFVDAAPAGELLAGVLLKDLEERERFGSRLRLNVNHAWRPVRERGTRRRPPPAHRVHAYEQHRAEAVEAAQTVIEEAQELDYQLTVLGNIRKAQLSRGVKRLAIDLRELTDAELGSVPAGDETYTRKAHRETLSSIDRHSRVIGMSRRVESMRAELRHLRERAATYLAEVDSHDPTIVFSDVFSDRPEIFRVSPMSLKPETLATVHIEGRNLLDSSIRRASGRNNALMSTDPSLVTLSTEFAGTSSVRVLSRSDEHITVAFRVPAASVAPSVTLSIAGMTSTPPIAITAPKPKPDKPEAWLEIPLHRGPDGLEKIKVPARALDEVGFDRALELIRTLKEEARGPKPLQQRKDEAGRAAEAVVDDLRIIAQSETLSRLERSLTRLAQAERGLHKSVLEAVNSEHVDSASRGNAAAALVELDKNSAAIEAARRAVQAAERAMDELKTQALDAGRVAASGNDAERLGLAAGLEASMARLRAATEQADARVKEVTMTAVAQLRLVTITVTKTDSVVEGTTDDEKTADAARRTRAASDSARRLQAELDRLHAEYAGSSAAATGAASAAKAVFASSSALAQRITQLKTALNELVNPTVPAAANPK